ncbi:MAG: hypothetical protein ACI9UO_002751 [Nitrospinales bacterium]
MRNSNIRDVSPIISGLRKDKMRQNNKIILKRIYQKNETHDPFIIFTPQTSRESFKHRNPDLIYSGSPGLSAPEALNAIKKPPRNAVQKLFFEPVKDRWGIRELL